jgi:hypothetical protein
MISSAYRRGEKKKDAITERESGGREGLMRVAQRRCNGL